MSAHLCCVQHHHHTPASRSFRSFCLPSFFPFPRPGTACRDVQWVSDSKLRCMIGPGLGGNREVVVRVGGQSSPPITEVFDYQQHIINSISPTHGSTEGGTGHKFAALSS